jgi:Ca2+-binding EF-hand superfamily protein
LIDEKEGYQISKRDLDKILGDADKNDDGFIDIQEFKDLLSGFTQKMTKKEFR